MSWKIFQRWFNVAPWHNADYVTDKKGEKFWLNWGTDFNLDPEMWVYYKGKRVGIVQTYWDEEGGLILTDFNIFESYGYLRKRGVGKQMMLRYIKRAKEKGTRYIKGLIVPHDGSSQEYLVEWYKRQDFQVDGNVIHLEL